LKPGDVVVGVLVGAQETKVRPAVVIASATYLAERPDAVVGILTTKLPRMPGTTDYVLQDWQSAGLRAESCFRAFVLTAHRSELTVIGHLSGRNWGSVKARGSYGLRHLTGLRSPAAPSFICLGHGGPNNETRQTR
jgi:mRNA interferase MazF